MEPTYYPAFALFALLYLASTSTVHAETYKGDNPVQLGQPWSITCEGVHSGVIWRKDGETLDAIELSTGNLKVEPLPQKNSSVLYARQAMEQHGGSYKCTSGSTEPFVLEIDTNIAFKVLTKSDLKMELACANQTSNAEWYRTEEGSSKQYRVDDESGEEDKKLYEIDDTTGTLSILKIDEDVYGDYVCKVGGSSKTYKVVRKPLVQLSSSTNIVEGEKLSLNCTLQTHRGVKVSWIFNGQTYNQSSGRVKVIVGDGYGAKLEVEDIAMSDKGTVSCRAMYPSNAKEHQISEAHTLLRVKDKLAALWPFLGICAEVFILCTIILIYEKKRNKAELEESDTDQSPDTKPQNKDSDVRQRK